VDNLDHHNLGDGMFKFLFEKVGGKTKIETQRDTVARTVAELNSVLALMADKPVVGVDLNTGLINVDLPDQMPDEALALPAPKGDVVQEAEEKTAA
jgi:hypothetical protein